MPAIRAEDVARTYGETVALDGVSLSVPEGEVFALVGPNGAGKTTLVRALTGTTDAEGLVEVFGEDPQTVDRKRIGLLPQSFRPAERLTARELVAYYGGMYEEARDPEAVLADVGMTDDADTHYENLSGGQQRRTCVATALVNDPDLLVLDEPTTGIDPAGRRALWGLLENLAAAGTTVFLTTHYMEEAQRLADRVGLLADGALVALDTPAALVAEHGGDSRLRIEGVHATGAEAAPGDESGQTPSDPDRPAVDDEAVTDPLDYPASMDGTTMTVRDVQPEAIGDVVDALAAAGVGYESLTWTEPTLEEVYLELTGQSVTAGGKAVDTAVPSGDEPAPPREEGQL